MGPSLWWVLQRTVWRRKEEERDRNQGNVISLVCKVCFRRSITHHTQTDWSGWYILALFSTLARCLLPYNKMCLVLYKNRNEMISSVAERNRMLCSCWGKGRKRKVKWEESQGSVHQELGKAKKFRGWVLDWGRWRGNLFQGSLRCPPSQTMSLRKLSHGQDPQSKIFLKQIHPQWYV